MRQPCDETCAFGVRLKNPDFADDWLWCSHPANGARVVRRDRDCPLYRPRAAEQR